MFNTEHANLFLLGHDYLAYQLLGSKLNKNEQNEIISTTFTVYAPHAKEVRLIAEFNFYNGSEHVFNKVHPQGFFQITIHRNMEYELYKYEIITTSGEILHKSDPFGFYHELRPGNASKVYDIDGYEWHDQLFIEHRKPLDKEPVLIYEVHLGSWRRKFGGFKPYNEVCHELIEYVKNQGFTHIELMPIYEHPLDDSWGYQGTGFYSATSRYGSPKDLMYLIDQCHQNNIGVIIDWVLGHINKDSFGLSRFDGSFLYEYEDGFKRENVTWGTVNLDFSKGITKSFMSSALHFWMEYFHVDGFRIDAVSNLIYYLGNKDNGVNLEATNYLKELSSSLYEKNPYLLFSAEDSTDFPKVTHKVKEGGLGFNYKWNMGFMNDTLEYFKNDPIYRKYHHHKLTFGMVYTYNEQFILPYSHDEVVHMKGSLWNKMSGSYEQKFANLRVLMTFYMTHPGKKLLFMGQEFAQISEWDFKKELDWNLLTFPIHDSFNRYFRDLAQVYRHHTALYQKDHDPSGFKWVMVDNMNQSIYAYLRFSDDETLLIIHNMTPNFYQTYQLGVPFEGFYEEILNSDKDIYSGHNQYNGLSLKSTKGQVHGFDNFITLKVAGLTSMIFKYKKSK